MRLREVPLTSCLEYNPMNCLTYGHMKRGVWYLKFKNEWGQGFYTKRAIQILYEDELGRPLEKDEWLQQKCKTRGCLNPSHYQHKHSIQLKEEEMFTKEQVRILFEQAIARGSVTFPIQNEAKAKKIRLGIYTHKRKLAQEDPAFGKKMEDYELVVREGNLICQRRGLDVEDLFAAAGLPSTSEYTQWEAEQKRLNELARKEYEEMYKAEDKADTTLANLGYSPKTRHTTPQMQNEGPSPSMQATPKYDAAYAKAAAGQPLTPEEEALLNDIPKE